MPLWTTDSVGSDAVSDKFVDMLRHDGIDTAHVARDADRTMGLYMIEMAGAERSFSYWREASVPWRFANDSAWLGRAFTDTGLIHFSGITLGILDDESREPRAESRERLANSLQQARNAGTRISFDPNMPSKL